MHTTVFGHLKPVFGPNARIEASEPMFYVKRKDAFRLVNLGIARMVDEGRAVRWLAKNLNPLRADIEIIIPEIVHGNGPDCMTPDSADKWWVAQSEQPGAHVIHLNAANSFCGKVITGIWHGFAKTTKGLEPFTPTRPIEQKYAERAMAFA